MKSLSLYLTPKRNLRRDDRAGTTRRDFWRTHYDYQATAEAPARSSAVAASDRTITDAAEIRSFRQLSREAVGSESRSLFVMETAVLGLIVGIVAWPLVSLAILLAQIAQGWL